MDKLHIMVKQIMKISWMAWPILFGVQPDFASADQASQDQAIVDQFFPDKLLSVKKFRSMLGKESTFLSADLDMTGKNDYIIAAYSNGRTGAIRILRRQGNTAVLADGPDFRRMGGSQPLLTLRDLTGDGKPEILLAFNAMFDDSVDWVFSWNGHSLDVIGPTKRDNSGELTTLIGNAGVVDIYGNGQLQIVEGKDMKSYPSENEEFALVYPRNIYALSNGKFVKSESFFFNWRFERESGTPQERKLRFKVGETKNYFLLKVINGGPNKSNRVSSAEVKINGKLVLGPSSFSQDKGLITAKMVLTQSKNEVSVLLKSAPGSFIRILVEPTDEPVVAP